MKNNREIMRLLKKSYKLAKNQNRKIDAMISDYARTFGISNRTAYRWLNHKKAKCQ